MKNMLKKEKAITLIALIVTIVILLILAGVTIATLTGDNGLYGRAKQAKENYSISEAKEKLTTKLMQLQTEIIVDEGKEASIEDVNRFIDTNSKYYDKEIEDIKDKKENKIIKILGYYFEVDNKLDIIGDIDASELAQTETTYKVNSINEKTVMWLTNLCLTVIACVALFIIIRLILMAVYMIINGITEAPIIKGVNKFMGGIFATINIIFIIFLLLALVSMFAPAESNLYEMIEKTYAVKYLYNYNILLQLFMKI